MESAGTKDNSISPSQGIQNGNHEEADGELEIGEKEDKVSLPSSASSLRLQALNGEYHVYETNSSNSGNSADGVNGNTLNEGSGEEVNNNVINTNHDEAFHIDSHEKKDSGNNHNDIKMENGNDDKESFNAKILTQTVLQDIIEDENDSD